MSDPVYDLTPDTDPDWDDAQDDLSLDPEFGSDADMFWVMGHGGVMMYLWPQATGHFPTDLFEFITYYQPELL